MSLYAKGFLTATYYEISTPNFGWHFKHFEFLEENLGSIFGPVLRAKNWYREGLGQRQ